MPANFGNEFTEAHLQAKLFQRFADGSLFGGLAFIHMPAGEGKVMYALAVAFDQGNFIVLDQNDGSAIAHGVFRSAEGKMNSEVKTISVRLWAVTDRDRAGSFTP